MSKFANTFTSYSIDSSLFIDVTAKRDDGQFWDFGTREKFEPMQQELQAELLIGSAPCISVLTLLHSSEKGMKEQIEKAQDEERDDTHKRASKRTRDS